MEYYKTKVKLNKIKKKIYLKPFMSRVANLKNFQVKLIDKIKIYIKQLLLHELIMNNQYKYCKCVSRILFSSVLVPYGSSIQLC